MRTLLTALTLAALGVASAATTTQYAMLTNVTPTPQGLRVTADYVDVFTPGPLEYARAQKLGFQGTLSAFYARMPGGLWVRNVNPQVRTLLFPTGTTFALACLQDQEGVRVVDAATFTAAWAGRPPKGCWPDTPKRLLVSVVSEDGGVAYVAQVYQP
ncbi:hypothetical protein [Deinococcus maricopensis]|uniref:Uncharacterized protein n=1 Tax=Deinococcus maricopensis (strain DSM 21211 / LMG 22137 / NRRL B-23946 / LB-34) TaxID=709986 RepID=E8UA85_DEIML|nr:hypothetical protein [Deinococcus maricopensis]ADV67974.1 hypothetical protein Deima_2336 [Deinococcus maricopensis DSM 21211]